MAPDLAAVAAALGLPGAEAAVEPIAGGPRPPLRVTLRLPGAAPVVVLARPLADEGARDHAAVLQALAERGFAHAPRPLASVEGYLVEEWVEGLTALAVVPPPGSFEAAVDALAAVHALELREGLRWQSEPSEMLAVGEIPLHRLGFAAHEREPAHGPLEEIRELLLESPHGFVHGNASAGHVLFARGRVVLTGWRQAGFGPKLLDLAAFLATCGADAPARRALAAYYARARGLPGAKTVDRVEAATARWGLHELLLVPRRQVEALGDDTASEAIRLGAARIERALREPAGDCAAVRALRAALWPQQR